MCTILIAPQITTKRSTDAVCYQDVKFNRAEHDEHRKAPSSMKWVVVIDEIGNRRLEMRWTVARSSLPAPATLGSATARCVRPAIGRVCDLMPGPETGRSISYLSRLGK